MRILSVLRERTSGGSPRSLSEVLNHWIDAHEVVLATADTEAAPDAPVFDPRIDVHRIGTFSETSTRFASQLSVGRNLRALIRTTRPDVVLAWGTWANLLTLSATVGIDVPVIVAERVDPRFRGTWLRRRLRKVIYRVRRPDAFVVQTGALAEWVRGFLPSERVHIVPNPVAPAFARRPVGGTGSNVIVAAGRLVPQKGFDLLIRAFAAASASRPGLRLRILGEGDERTMLEGLARSLGVADRVDLPGFVGDPEREFVAADLFVLSSRFEGFARVLGEAMACGLAVVASDCPPGQGDVVRTGTDGLLVPCGDVPALSEAIGRLMDDPSLREEMAARAPEIVERFEASTVFARWDDVLATTTKH
jgi:glycosyltransferase involved in cell wall biosynthesis